MRRRHRVGRPDDQLRIGLVGVGEEGAVELLLADRDRRPARSDALEPLGRAEIGRPAGIHRRIGREHAVAAGNLQDVEHRGRARIEGHAADGGILEYDAVLVAAGDAAGEPAVGQVLIVGLRGDIVPGGGLVEARPLHPVGKRQQAAEHHEPVDDRHIGGLRRRAPQVGEGGGAGEVEHLRRHVLLHRNDEVVELHELPVEGGGERRIGAAGEAHVGPGEAGIVELVEPGRGAGEGRDRAVGVAGEEGTAAGRRQRLRERIEIPERPVAVPARQHILDGERARALIIGNVRPPLGERQEGHGLSLSRP